MVVDEIKIRLTAFWVLLLAVSFFFFRIPEIPVVLVIDFALRSFNLGKWSPLLRLSSAVATSLNWKGRPVFLPAKRFAARVGFVLSLLILLLVGLGSPVAVLLDGVLSFFAALESLLGFCAGCYIYDWIVRLGIK